MDIRPLDPDDLGTMKQVVDLETATEAHDAPWRHPMTLRSLDAEIRWAWDLEPGRHMVAFDGDAMVAHGILELSERDNLDLAWFGISVSPHLRRRSYGTAMLRHLQDEARAAGRTKAGAYSWDGSPGADFAAAHGYPKRFQSINRRQHLDEVSLDKVRSLYDDAAAAAADYGLVLVEGRTPPEMLDSMVEMVAAINDAPLDDLEIEDEVYSADRIAAYETAQLNAGLRLHRYLARHRATGELAGNTVVAVEEERDHVAHQQDTSVVASHRGHRLGLLLKTAMLLHLADKEPQVRTIDTFNAESNDHMIAVNEDLGYRWMGRGLGFQRSLVD